MNLKKMDEKLCAGLTWLKTGGLLWTR